MEQPRQDQKLCGNCEDLGCFLPPILILSHLQVCGAFFISVRVFSGHSPSWFHTAWTCVVGEAIELCVCRVTSASCKRWVKPARQCMFMKFSKKNPRNERNHVEEIVAPKIFSLWLQVRWPPRQRLRWLSCACSTPMQTRAKCQGRMESTGKCSTKESHGCFGPRLLLKTLTKSCATSLAALSIDTSPNCSDRSYYFYSHYSFYSATPSCSTFCTLTALIVFPGWHAPDFGKGKVPGSFWEVPEVVMKFVFFNELLAFVSRTSDHSDHTSVARSSCRNIRSGNSPNLGRHGRHSSKSNCLRLFSDVSEVPVFSHHHTSAEHGDAAKSCSRHSWKKIVGPCGGEVFYRCYFVHVESFDVMSFIPSMYQFVHVHVGLVDWHAKKNMALVTNDSSVWAYGIPWNYVFLHGEGPAPNKAIEHTNQRMSTNK